MGLKQLNQLFDVYSKSLSVVNPGIGEAFVCPLCLQTFGRDAIQARTLSVEHVPPRSIGSSIATLTCRQCNNTVGNRLQNQMKNYVRKKEFWGGRVIQPIPARAEMAGTTWSFVITEVTRKRSVKGFSLPTHVPPQIWPTDPSVFVGKQVHISLRLRSSPNVVNAAYLHSAYLTMFHYMGYQYIMQPALDPVRTKIASFSTKGGIPHRLHVPGVYLDPRDSRIEIVMFWQSIDVSCLCVIVGGEVVLMPFMNDSYVNIFQMLYEHTEKVENREKRRLPLRAAALLIDPGVKFFTGFKFESAEPIDNVQALKLVPIGESKES